MPPFNPNPASKQEENVSPIDYHIKHSVLPKLKNVSVSEVRSIILRSFEGTYYESSLNVFQLGESEALARGIFQEEFDRVNNEILELFDAIHKRCPSDLDRIEFEQWLTRNAENLYSVDVLSKIKESKM